jgi:hypothetical protein
MATVDPLRNEFGLTPSEEAAAQAYLLCSNQSDAFLVGFPAYEATPGSVPVLAHRLFAKPAVAARLIQLRDEAARQSHLSRDEALAILADIARGKVPKYLDEQGDIDLGTVKRAGGSDIEGVEHDESEKGGRKLRLRVRNPIQAIERIARMCGWDKQATFLSGEGISITLHMGEPPDESQG